MGARFNDYQSTLEDLGIDNEPEEIKEQFFEAINSIPYIKNLISPSRLRARDLPRDDKGRIIVDLTQPHILEDMDYFRPSAIHYQQTGRYTDLRPNPNKNSEYGKWIREEVRRCHEGYVRESDGEWIPGDYYFFLNYCPMSLIKKEDGNKKKAMRVIDFPAVWEGHYLKFHYLFQARENGKHAGELASRSKGKAHPYDTVVYTPEGKKVWKDITIGSRLFGSDGKIITVTDIPFDDVAPIYKVHLKDGRTVECSAGHLFKVRDRRKRIQERILSVEDIYNSDYRHVRKNGSTECYFSIPNNGCVEYPYQEIPIDAYTLGLTLGDAEHIPEIYLYNSKEVRLELLRGLLDASIKVNNKVIATVITSSVQLADDVMLLCRSLGYKCSMVSKTSFYKNSNSEKVTGPACYNIIIKNKTKWISIVNIEYVGDKRAKCVTVDSEDHLYLIGDYIVTHNSFCGASLLAKRFILGESKEVNRKVVGYITASDKKYLVAGDQTLDKFLFDIDWCADNTEFPSKRLIDTLQNMQWKMGYKDLDKGTSQGTQNSVIGVTSKDDESKLRGTRGVIYIIEEWGTFPRLLETYNNILDSTADGEDVFGLIYCYGTAGDNESDFSSAQELMYHPEGYSMQAIPNVYDKPGQGRKSFVYFFPGYMNLSGCYDSNGNSDVTKALLVILKKRYNIKHNSTNMKTLVKRVAEIPITPQEAILRVKGSMFPVTQLNDRLNEIDNNPNFYADVHVGDLVLNRGGSVSYVPTSAEPIRQYPLKDNKEEGAIEFYMMPELGLDGKPFPGRYVGGLDPVDDDVSNTMSLVSCYIFDLWTDRIAASWTGRLSSADDCYERCRRMAIFYNAQILYENDKKGAFAYFSRMHSLIYLADIPEFLKSMYSEKGPLWGNKLKGYKATAPINSQADQFSKDWLLKMQIVQDSEGNQVELPNIMFLKDRGLIQEMIAYNPVANFDRIRAFGAVMLMREERLMQCGGDVQGVTKNMGGSKAADDEFFTKNYDDFFGPDSSFDL